MTMTPAISLRGPLTFDKAAQLIKALSFSRPWLPLIAGLLIVLGVGILTTRTVIRSDDDSQQVRDSLITIGTADALMLSIVEMNNAQRGYILSRNPAFLDRFSDESRSLATRQAALVAQLSADPGAAELAEQLETEMRARKMTFVDIERRIALGDISGAGAISVAARTRTDDVRQVIDAIKAYADGQLKKRQSDASRTGNRALVLAISGLFSAAMLIVIATIFLARRSADLERANAEVSALAQSLERRVSERTADLAEANEEIQRFAYIVSHDLRSPLVNVMGFTAELKDAQEIAASYIATLAQADPTSVPAEVRTAVVEDMPEAMNFIRAATGRMDRLIKAILQISREGRRSMVVEKVDLGALLANLHDTLSGQLDAVNAEVTIAPLPEVHSDPLALEQVFGNLLDNAIKYLKPGVPGRIAVSGERKGGKAIVRIKDNGRGVAPVDQRRIFELFRRAGQQDQPGEGIGLAHVQALLRRMGGKIELTSALGEGSCFTVTLPISMSPAAR
ncbi:MAG: GHKL domain-containing protein [Sphingomonadales bacterium]|nr:GHKL domain-containing protein [Sphingomonadales bacterium]NCQ22690.1 GHKL domain-containing protein [Sphingomonadales bacterium]NCT04886.1 GHKL domain-containing protein [Sphingomonadales bacterium]